LKKHLSFTRNQKLGAASIAIVIVLLTLILNVNYHQSLGPNPEIDRTSLTYLNLSNTQDQTQPIFSEMNQSKSKTVLHDFDPNTISVKEWEELGFSHKQAGAIVKYRENYGPFKTAEDVNKIYVVSEEKYAELKPFMRFSSNSDEAQVVEKQLIIEINSASKTDLESISGIGPVFSERILKYRTALGGFVSKAQFSEVYGLKDESLKALEANVEINKDAIKKLPINTASKDEIKAHPYLKDWMIITSILKKRDRQKLSNLNFLVEEKLVTEEQLTIILPYITFEE
jgi:DNA uptake protein ComE-like DNA-binding protein